MSSLYLGLGHRQLQGLSPRLQRAVRLLQMSSLDFTQEVHDMIGKNPFLESDDGDAESERMAGDEHTAAARMVDAAGGPAAFEASESLVFEYADPPSASERESMQATVAGIDDAASVERAPAAQGSDGGGDTDFDAHDDRDIWAADGSMPCSSDRGRSDDREFNAMDLQATQVSLGEHLLGQISLLPLSTRDAAIVEAIIGSLDDDGYLRAPLGDLAAISELAPPPDDEELRIALSRVQALDPAGVGARGVQECLMLQLSACDGEGQAVPGQAIRMLARRIVGEQLALLTARDTSGLARALGCTPTAVATALDCLRRLDPRPGLRFGSVRTEYVTPDVIVRKTRGEWTVKLNPAVVPRVRLNRVYAEMFQRSRTAQHGELAAHLNEARWTVSNVEQRFATILSVAQAIVGRQSRFLDHGPLAMKPLGLREIADEVGVHESTVSRVTNNKFMATPLGVFEFKYFFSRAMGMTSGGECSATAIRGLIRDMIDAEAPNDPLSDAELARRLARQGIVVARRTVTKYRQLMRVGSFEKRRNTA